MLTHLCSSHRQTQLQESITQLSASVGHSVTSWAASATRGTNLPKVSPTARPQKVNKTLHHALSRAAASGALQLGADPSNLSGLPNLETAQAPGSDAPVKDDSKLGEALQKFAIAEDRLGNARLTQDDQITQGFNVPFNSFGAQIALAMKARQNVTDARLHLDSWKQSLKSAENAGASAKLEQYRNDVEQAEDKLVASTEEAISLMKQVLENPEPIKSLSAFVKAYVPDPTLHPHTDHPADILVFIVVAFLLACSVCPYCFVINFRCLDECSEAQD